VHESETGPSISRIILTNRPFGFTRFLPKYDDFGEIFGRRDANKNAMLLRDFLKSNRTVGVCG
jgi:hypothetical protein